MICRFAVHVSASVASCLAGQRSIAVIPDDVAAILGSKSSELLLSVATAAKKYGWRLKIGIADYAIVQDILERGEIIKNRDLHIRIAYQTDGWYYAVIKTTRMRRAVYLQSLRNINFTDIERMCARDEVLRLVS